jgi:hypothetical protein
MPVATSGNADPGAEGRKSTIVASGPPRPADVAAVGDQAVAQVDPFLGPECGHQVALDLLGGLVLREPESPRQAADMGVHDEP